MTHARVDRDAEEQALRELRQTDAWGRWGSEDERGALNYVTPEAVRRGTAAVRHGRVYPLSVHVRENRVPLLAGRPAPLHLMGLDGGDYAAGMVAKHLPDQQTAEDYLVVGTHGTTTHLDALCHVWTGGRMYNGFSGNLVRSYGATRLGVENVEGIVTRGVLLDVAGLRGVDVLPADYLVTERDLVECGERQGTLPLQSGDAVLVRTGWTTVFGRDEDAYSGMQPGIGSTAARHLVRSEVCLVGSDNTAVNAFSGYNPRHPERVLADWREGLADLHVPLLRNHGVYLLEMMDLEQLAADRVHSFLFCCAPLLVKGGTGSPVNPLAVS